MIEEYNGMYIKRIGRSYQYNYRIYTSKLKTNGERVIGKALLKQGSYAIYWTYWSKKEILAVIDILIDTSHEDHELWWEYVPEHQRRELGKL